MTNFDNTLTHINSYIIMSVGDLRAVHFTLTFEVKG